MRSHQNAGSPAKNLAKSWLENFKFFILTLRLQKIACLQFSLCYCIAKTLNFHLIPKNHHNTRNYHTFSLKNQNTILKVEV